MPDSVPLANPKLKSSTRKVRVGDKIKCSVCKNTNMSPGGLVNLSAYLGGEGKLRGWVCQKHLPDDFMGKPITRLPVREMFAVHAYVEKNMEVLSRQVKVPKQTPD
jgi:hypothetical protein